jgi:hypothetical protein
MTDQEILRSIDSATEGVESLAANVVRGIDESKSGWFACRIKLQAGRVAIVQVSTDVEIMGAVEPTKGGNRA